MRNFKSMCELYWLTINYFICQNFTDWWLAKNRAEWMLGYEHKKQ